MVPALAIGFPITLALRLDIQAGAFLCPFDTYFAGRSRVHHTRAADLNLLSVHFEYSPQHCNTCIGVADRSMLRT